MNRFIETHDNFLTPEECEGVFNYLQQPIFSGTQTSTGNGRVFFRADLHDSEHFHSLIPRLLPLFPTQNLEFFRCWAIAHQTGSHGNVHTDCGDCTEGQYYSAIIYPNLNWSVDWGGETIFFDDQKYEIIKSILPKPNSCVVFDSSILHAARPTTSNFMGIRYVVNYMFKVVDIDS
jgi:Rps23 Pro-64 3,4-dihydroxylase Tpa1-like proline 4-hydroxylase